MRNSVWKLSFDGKEVHGRIDVLPGGDDIEAREINYLDAKRWLPGKDTSGNFRFFFKNKECDLWEGSKDIVLIYGVSCGEITEYFESWILKDASVKRIKDETLVHYKQIVYYGVA